MSVGVEAHSERKEDITRRWVCRTGGFLVISLWILAFFLPYAGFNPRFGVRIGQEHGYLLGLYGWAGIILLNVSWYANIPLFSIIISLFRGKAPGLKLTIFTTILASDALFPIYAYDFEITGEFKEGHIFGPAVFAWLSSFCVNALLCIYLYSYDIRSRIEIILRNLGN